MRVVRVALATLVAALLGAAASNAAPTVKPAPRLAHPTAAAKPLVTRFFNLLVNRDIARLRGFLSPAFQVQRADGSAETKAAYLAHLSTVNSFSLTNFVATQAGATLVVRYVAVAEGVVNGKPYTPGPAPRLSVFAWNGARWQLAAHANFNPLSG